MDKPKNSSRVIFKKKVIPSDSIDGLLRKTQKCYLEEDIDISDSVLPSNQRGSLKEQEGYLKRHKKTLSREQVRILASRRIVEKAPWFKYP